MTPSWLRTRALLVVGCVGVLACSDSSRPSDQRVDVRDGGTDGRDIGEKKCALNVASINGKAVSGVTSLSAADDLDIEKPGIQVDVEVKGTNLPDATQVKLYVSGQGDPLTKNAASGSAVFNMVTVLVDSVVIFRAAADVCMEDQTKSISVTPTPECTFLAPTDGKGLGPADSKTTPPPFLYDVKIYTKSATGGQVVLNVNGSAQAAKQPDTYGQVVYTNQILPEGTVQLKAEVSVGTVKRSCVANVVVATGAPLCSLHPIANAYSMTGGGVGLGKKADIDPTATKASPRIFVAVEVTSDSGNNVNLVADGLVVGSPVVASGGVAVFDKVTLLDGQRVIYATCTHPKTGTTNQSPSGNFLVDSVSPTKVTDFSCAVSTSAQGVSLNREGKITCSWTATGDNVGGSGVEFARIRYQADAALSESNWSAATVLSDIISPGAQGTQRDERFVGLKLGHSYYLGLKEVDRVGNESELSIANALTLDFSRQERTLSDGSFANMEAIGGIMATGDFDCDGYSDVAVGQPTLEGGLGKVLIYLGSSNGVLPSPTKILSGTIDGANFGAGLATLPKFGASATKCNDLAVLASYGGSSNKSRVYVYLGRSDFSDREDVTAGKGAELMLQLASSAPTTQRLGPALASAGDFDNDGVTDLAVALGDTGAGSVSMLVVYGIKTLQPIQIPGSATPIVSELPASAGVQIGPGLLADSFASSLGDGAQLDSDDYNDLMIGAKDTKVSGTTRGAAYVVRGGARASTLPESIALSSARVQTISGGSANSAFGTSLGFVGDMNKDGQRKFAVGDPLVSSGAGAVYLFALNTNPTTTADAVATVPNDLSSAAGNNFGMIIAGAGNIDPVYGGDFNNDTYPDLAAGARGKGATAVGAVFMFQGAMGTLNFATSKAAYTWNGPAAAPSFANTVVLAKDINGDGYLDLVIGDPQATSGKGRFFVYY